MNRHTAPWSRTIALHHSCFLFILLPYICDLAYGRLLYLGLGWAAFLIVLPLKIYLTGGLYGMLIEFVSGEEIAPRVDRFAHNAGQYWKPFLLLQTIPLILHFTATALWPDLRAVPIYAAYALLFTPLVFIFIQILLRQKYLQPLNIPGRRLAPSLKEAAVLITLVTGQMLSFQFPYWLKDSLFAWPQFTLLALNYFNQLIFIYLAAASTAAFPEIERHHTFDKEVYMINPLGGGFAFHFASLFLRSYPPVFVVIKALTPKSYHFREFNYLPWHPRYYAGGKLVAITCFTSNCDDAYRIAREYKKRGSTVVMGGPHVTYAPQEALEYCDSVVTGEAESVWQELIADYENGMLKKIYSGVPLEECYEMIYDELMSSPPSVVKDFLETTRGCKFKCRFCTIPDFSGGKVRTRPVFELVELLKKVRTRYRHVLFVDNNIYSDPAYAKELFEAIKPVGIRWSTQCTIDIAKNAETLKLAKEAGCDSLLIGFEIEGDSEESRQGGKFAMAAKFKDYVKKIKAHGIGIKAHFIFGFDTHTWRHLWRLWAFAFSIRPAISVISLLTPYPGSHLYGDMFKADRITNLNWRHYGCQSLVIEHDKVNNYVLARIWPAVMALFFLTTSTAGMTVSVFIVVFALLAA